MNLVYDPDYQSYDLVDLGSTRLYIVYSIPEGHITHRTIEGYIPPWINLYRYHKAIRTILEVV